MDKTSRTIEYNHIPENKTISGCKIISFFLQRLTISKWTRLLGHSVYNRSIGYISILYTFSDELCSVQKNWLSVVWFYKEL